MNLNRYYLPPISEADGIGVFIIDNLIYPPIRNLNQLSKVQIAIALSTDDRPC